MSNDNKQGANVAPTGEAIECCIRLAEMLPNASSERAKSIREGLSGVLRNIQSARTMLDSHDRWLAAVSIQRVIDGMDEMDGTPMSWAGIRAQSMILQGLDMMRSIVTAAE